MSEQAKIVKANIAIILEPLADIHYNSDLPHDFPKGNKMYVFIFAIVGLFIVVITSINYINMSTAFASNRAKEIGIKKIFGAEVKTLRLYFLIESVLLTMFAFLISIFVIRLIIDSDSLYQIFNVKLHFKLFENFDLYIISMGFAILIGLFSGLYPAFHLSSITLAGLVSTSFEHKKRSSFFRKFLIVFQFVLSISVLVGVLAMNKQINYVNDKDLGYNRDNLIVIPVDNMGNSEISVLKEKLLRNPKIISVSSSYLLPNTQDFMCNFRIESDSGFEEQLLNWSVVGTDYFKTMEIQFIEGRDFNKGFPSDANSAYIVNESFLKHFTWKNAVGKKMQIINGGYFNWPEGKIIGVVKDFNIASLHKEIEPIIFVMLSGGNLHVRIDGVNIENTLREINSEWTAIAPDTDINLKFMNKHLSDSYLIEKNQFKLVKIFSVICIILSCLGLMGLSAYTLSLRTKEVAIRKQLGSSTFQIIIVLYKEIAALILIAIIITIPLSIWVVNLWLDSFAYRINVGVMIFVISGLAAFLIGFLSVLYHSVKLAYTNPVEALKHE
jgi:putative ABC transport system permease protein